MSIDEADAGSGPGRERRTGPLAGERVLDLSAGIGASYCAKLLGDLGADVVKVEAPAGPEAAGPARGGAVRRGEDGPEFSYFNTSKRSITLDFDTDDSFVLLSALVQNYDVVIADGPEGALAQRGLGWSELSDMNPSVILTTVSGFGSDGPYRDYQSSHLIACALGGWATTCGLPDRPPLQAGGHLTDTVGGAYAAVGTLAAIESRARTGSGDHVDVSDWEAALTCAFFPSLTWEYHGEKWTRHTDYATGPSFNLRCRDGYIGVNVLTEPQWELLCAFIGRPDFAVDPRFSGYYGRLKYVDEIRDAIEAALADRDVEEIFHDAQVWRLPFGMLLSPRQAMELEVHQARHYFETVDGDIGVHRTPRVPFLMSATPSRPTRAPGLGEHNDEILVPLTGGGAGES